jgi:hypothetical protein
MPRRLYAQVEEVEIEVVAVVVTLGLMSGLELVVLRMYAAVAEG